MVEDKNKNDAQTTNNKSQEIVNSKCDRSNTQNNINNRYNKNIISSNTNNSENNDQNNENRDFADKTIDAVEKFMNTKDHVNEHHKSDIEVNRVVACICYIPFLFLLNMFSKNYKDSKYLHFHVNQGIIVSLVWLFVITFTNLLGTIFLKESIFTTHLPKIISFINYILHCIAFLYSLFGLVNTYNGNSKELPIIGRIKILK